MPRFSILTPVYRPPPAALESMLASVREQWFEDWEHCLVDDCSDDPRLRATLERVASEDPRVRVAYRDRNEGIVAATNDALDFAEGEFVAFLDHDDELAPRALSEVAAALATHPEVDYLYTDEDKVGGLGRHSEPFLKPAHSPDRLRAQMYPGHLVVVRRSLLEELGGLRAGFDGAQDWDLALRVAHRTDRIVSIPGVLYHWRAVAGSEAEAIAAKPWAHEASRKAVAEDVERQGIQARPETIPGYPGLYWLRPALVDRPLVSVIVPSPGRTAGDGSSALETRWIAERSTYDNYELVVVDSGAAGFAANINRGVGQCAGEQILLLDQSLELLASGRHDWIESLLVYALQREVGAAGSRILDAEGRIRHAGVILRNGEARDAYRGQPGAITGYGANQLVATNFIAVRAAGMMTSRDAFDAVGGFDEVLPREYAEVDYCLKLRERGLRSVNVPQVELVASRPEADEVGRAASPAALDAFRRRWSSVLEIDPFYRSTFLDDHFTLPGQTEDGGFRPSTGPGSYFDRVRRAYGRSRLRDLIGRVRS